MQRFFLKFLSVLMLFALVCGLVACNSTGGTTVATTTAPTGTGTTTAAPTTTKAEEIPTVTVVTTWDPGINISGDSQIFTEWGKRTGVKFEVTVNPRDNHKDKVNILMTSNELPDLLKFFQDSTSYQEYGAKLFEPLDGYLTNGQLPNLQKYLKKYAEIESKIRAPKDGKIYGFPIVQDFDYFSNLWYTRNDLLKSQGLDAKNIKTLDDFKAACLALKAATGKDYITSTRLGYSYYSGMVGVYFGTPFGIMYDATTAAGTKKYVIGALAHTDMLKAFVETENWMIVNKLLHPNFLTMKDQELFAGYADGSFPLMREQFTMPYTAVSSMNPNNDPKIEIAPIYPFTINGVQNTVAKSVHYNISYRGPWCVNVKSASKAKIMSALDYVYSDEGVELCFLGIEGETFERDKTTPSGYRLINVQSVWTKKADGTYPDGMKTLKDYGFDAWWVTGVVPAFNRFALMNYKAGEESKALITTNEAAYMNTNGLLRNPDPDIILTTEESQTISETMTAFNTLLEENVAKFILGTKPLSEFDAFIEQLKAYKVDKVLEIYNSKLK